MIDIKYLNPFININPPDYSSINEETQSLIQSSNNIGNLQTLSAGAGDEAMHFDKQGLWLGDKNFDNAPFSVTPDGDMTILQGTIRFRDADGYTRVFIGELNE